MSNTIIVQNGTIFFFLASSQNKKKFCLHYRHRNPVVFAIVFSHQHGRLLLTAVTGSRRLPFHYCRATIIRFHLPNRHRMTEIWFRNLCGNRLIRRSIANWGLRHIRGRWSITIEVFHCRRMTKIWSRQPSGNRLCRSIVKGGFQQHPITNWTFRQRRRMPLGCPILVMARRTMKARWYCSTNAVICIQTTTLIPMPLIAAIKTTKNPVILKWEAADNGQNGRRSPNNIYFFSKTIIFCYT